MTVSTSTATGVASPRVVTSPPDPAVAEGASIQQRAVIPIITVRGVIAQAQSGAGKTSMISLFVCQVNETNVHEVQALETTWRGASPTGRTCSWTAGPWLSRSTTSGLSRAFRVPLKKYTQVAYSRYRP